jgi:hypothetical protein
MERLKWYILILLALPPETVRPVGERRKAASSGIETTADEADAPAG